jgi:hypothetical protein
MSLRCGGMMSLGSFSVSVVDFDCLIWMSGDHRVFCEALCPSTSVEPSIRPETDSVCPSTVSFLSFTYWLLSFTRLTGHTFPVHKLLAMRTLVIVTGSIMKLPLNGSLSGTAKIIMEFGGILIVSCSNIRAGRIVKNVHIKIGSQTITWDVCTATLRYDVILGLDFLEAHKAVIRLGAETVKINGELIQAKLVANQTTENSVARILLHETINIPANSMMTVAVPLKEPLRGNFIMEPVPITKVLIASSLCTGNVCPVNLVNDSNQYVKRYCTGTNRGCCRSDGRFHRGAGA